jgi:hypothetical protein
MHAEHDPERQKAGFREAPVPESMEKFHRDSRCSTPRLDISPELRPSTGKKSWSRMEARIATPPDVEASSLSAYFVWIGIVTR